MPSKRRTRPFDIPPPTGPRPAADSRQLIDRARQLRHRQTDVELTLWRHLRRSQIGVKFRRQHPIAGYIVDFYCEEARLAVELDGGGHAAVGQFRYDRVRTELLERVGVKLLRFWNTDVFGNLDGVLETILKEVLRRR